MAMNKERVLENLRKFRKAKGIKQGEVAAHLGIRQPSYSLLERGKNEISLAQLFKIADFLKLDILDFFAPPEDVEAIRAFSSLVSRLPVDKKTKLLKTLQLQELLLE